MYANPHIHKHLYLSVCVYTCICICLYTYICCTCIYIYTYKPWVYTDDWFQFISTKFVLVFPLSLSVTSFSNGKQAGSHLSCLCVIRRSLFHWFWWTPKVALELLNSHISVRNKLTDEMQHLCAVLFACSCTVSS